MKRDHHYNADNVVLFILIPFKNHGCVQYRRGHQYRVYGCKLKQNLAVALWYIGFIPEKRGYVRL